MYATGATAVPPVYTSTHLSATFPTLASASAPAVTDASVAASACAILSPRAAPVPQTTYSCSATSNTAMSYSPSSPFSAAAANTAPGSPVWFPALSFSTHSSSVTALDAFTNSSCTRHPVPRVTRVRRFFLKRCAATFDSCTPNPDQPSSSAPSNTLPFPSGPLEGLAFSCSPVASRVPSLTVAAASSSAAHVTASFRNASSASLTPDTDVPPSPQVAASTLSAAATAASLRSCTGAVTFDAGAARQYPTTSVLYNSPGPASISHSSVPRICRGVPLLPFIRSRRSSTLPHMQLFGIKEKNESSFSRTGIRKGVKHVFTVEPTPTSRDPLVQEQAVEVCEGDNANTETAHVQLTATQLQPAKEAFPRTITAPFSQRQGTRNGERLPPQQKARRDVQTVLHHGYSQQRRQRPPPQQVKQCILSFSIYSQLKTEEVSTKVVETPQEQQWVPQKFTSATCPHPKPQQWCTPEPGKKYTQPDRSQSPGQAKQQQMTSQLLKQQEAAKQVQQQLTHRQQQQSPRQRLERLHQQQERPHSLQQQKLSQQQQHGVTREQQTNSGEPPLKKEMSGHSVAVASPYKPLRTSNNNMREQLVCYVCLSAATAAVGNGEIPVTSLHRDGVLPTPTSSSAVTDGYTGKIVPRLDITATNCLQAPALFESHGHSSEGSSSLAVSTKGYKGGACNRTNTKDNVSSGSRCELPGACSGTIDFGDPSSVGGYIGKNSVVISGSEGNGGIRSTTTSYRFYEVGGLVLCQQCALLPGVHTAQQVNALLEEALCFLAEEAGVNFNHPALLELHGIALGGSSGHQGSTFSSPHDTTDISRSDSECGRMHSSDFNRPHRKNTCTITEAQNSSSKQTSCTASCSVSPSSSRSKQTSSTASSSSVRSSSSSEDDDGSISGLDSPAWECATIYGDMNSTRHRRRCDRIMAVSQGDRARAADTADNRRNSAGERPSKTDVREAEDSQLSSGNTAWEFPFYVEATSLSALLPPSGVEAAPAAVRHSAADNLVGEGTSRLVGNGRSPPAAAAATHHAATAGHATAEAAAAAAISKPVVLASHSSACLPADACSAGPPSGARFGRTSACTCNSNKVNHCLPPVSVSELGGRTMDCSCHAATRYLHPFEQSAVFLRQRVPERIVFGLCETLKVYLPQASVAGVRAARSRSGPALRQMGWSSEAAATRTAAADELTGTESSADVATNAADQDTSREGEGGPSALSVREAPLTRAATEVTSCDHKALAVLERHIEPYRSMKEKMSGLAAVETAEPSNTAEEVPARESSQLRASGEMEVKPPAAVSVDPSEEVELPSARAHAAIQPNRFAPSTEKGERTMVGSPTTYHKSVLHAVGKHPSSEARRRAVPAETAGVECKEAHPSRLEGHIGKRAADAADEGKDRVTRPTDTSPAIKTHPEGLRHAEEEVFARGTGLQSAVTNDVSSQSGAAGAQEAVGGNQVWGQPRTDTADREARQRELLGYDSSKEDMTSVEGFPDPIAAHTPADSACPSLPKVALHTNGGLLSNEERKSLLPHEKEDYLRSCRSKQAAAAGGTDASVVRARAEDAAPPLIDASFQPAVYRVAVARGLPEAVFLAHLGHELLHAYIWCTTDVAAAPATVPAEPRRAEANYLFAGNTKGFTPGVPKESSGFPLTSSAGSGRVASHNVGRPADDAALKVTRGVRSEKQQHANGCGNRLASAPADTCTGEYTWGVPDVHSNESAPHFYVRTGKEPVGAFRVAEGNSVSKRRGLAVAELVLASCPNLTNDGVDKRKKGRTRNRLGAKTHPQRRCSSAVPFSLALSTSGKIADTRNRTLQAKQQPGEHRVAPGAAPLHRFPPLELALEEGLCNCVAAALLERRAAASYVRLQKLLAAADAPRRKKQATTLKPGNSCARQSVSGTAPFVTRFPLNYDGLGSEESQAVQQNKIEQTSCHSEHMLPVTQQQQQLHSQHQVGAMHKEQQQRPHRKRESDLKQQKQQQLHSQFRQHHTLGELQECAQQHRQRNSLHPRPRMNSHEHGREPERDRFSKQQQRTQNKYYEQPLRREPDPQDAHVGRLILHEQLQGNDLPDEILRHQISVCLHELQVIQLRLRLTETDSHAVYGKSYKMLRILVKRFGLRTVLETARKRRLQQLVNHCASTLDA